MAASVFVGRVGGLAVALGIGLGAVGAVPAVAWASPESPAGEAGPAGDKATAQRSSASSRSGASERAAEAPPRRSPASDRSAPTRSANRSAGSTESNVAQGKSRTASARAEQQEAPSFGDIIQYTLFHRAPTASPAQNPGQSSIGVVSGNINAESASGGPLSYAVAQAPARGSVQLAQDGGYTYTPDAELAQAGGTDDFSVTIDNGSAYRLTGIAGLVQGLIATFAQLVGLRQPDTLTVAVPVSIVATGSTNSPPVAGTPVVGTPNATTGVVTGQIVASDPDGDTLTYSAPTTTAKGAVTINAVSGAFTYTPTAAARDAAASPTATEADRTDSFTATVSDGLASAQVLVGVPVSPKAIVVPADLTFTFTYGTGDQYWTEPARDALQWAADTLASYLVVDTPVNLTFSITADKAPDSDTLASAGSDLTTDKVGFYNTVVQSKVLTGVDANGSAADGEIDVNLGIDWAFGESVGSDQYDFKSTMLHELLHAFGFLSYIDEAGYNTGRNWAEFDRFVVDQDGTAVIGTDFRFKNAYETNLTGGDGGLWFGGSNAVDAYGGLVPIYTPDPWEPGSSGSHLDDFTFTGADTQLMNAAADSGPGVRVISAVELGILEDIGYTVNPQPSAALLFLGMLFLRRKRS